MVGLFFSLRMSSAKSIGRSLIMRKRSKKLFPLKPVEHPHLPRTLASAIIFTSDGGGTTSLSTLLGRQSTPILAATLRTLNSLLSLDSRSRKFLISVPNPSGYCVLLSTHCVKLSRLFLSRTINNFNQIY